MLVLTGLVCGCLSGGGEANLLDHYVDIGIENVGTQRLARATAMVDDYEFSAGFVGVGRKAVSLGVDVQVPPEAVVRWQTDNGPLHSQTVQCPTQLVGRARSDRLLMFRVNPDRGTVEALAFHHVKVNGTSELQPFP